MAQRFKSTDLKEMIRTLVRQEIKEVVFETINEVLTDRYMKAIVEKKVARLEERLEARLEALQEARIPVQGEEEDQEVTPEILANDDDGIYQESPLKKEGKDGSDFMSLFFEGAQPIPRADGGPLGGMPSVDM